MFIVKSYERIVHKRLGQPFQYRIFTQITKTSIPVINSRAEAELAKEYFVHVQLM